MVPISIEFLVEAYRRLDAASNRPMDRPAADGLEQAVRDIWLFGSSDQMELAEQFTEAFTKTGSGDTEPLLRTLRSTLRSELLLPSAPDRRQWLRISLGEGWGQAPERLGVSRPEGDRGPLDAG